MRFTEEVKVISSISFAFAEVGFSVLGVEFCCFSSLSFFTAYKPQLLLLTHPLHLQLCFCGFGAGFVFFGVDYVDWAAGFGVFGSFWGVIVFF